MKFKLIFCILLWAFLQAGFATKIKDIRAEDYQQSVCRLVLDLDQDVSFEAKQISEEWHITIPGFDGKLPSYAHESRMIKAIGVVAGGISIKTIPGLRVETMNLAPTKQAVIDFFAKPTDKAGRLAIARFYSDKGKYATADEKYFALAHDFGSEDDVLYYWGLLLMRRGSTRAKTKLMAISETSKYYEPAQKLLKMSSRYRLPEDLPADPVLEPVQDSLPPADTAYVAPKSISPQATKVKNCPNLAELWRKAYYSPFVYLVIAILVVVLFRFLPKRKKADPQPEGIHESSLSIDPDTLGRMVGRLMADGWTNKEIAKEMKISVREVEQLSHRQRHFNFKERNDDPK